MDVLQTLRALAESCLGSLFSHFSLQDRAFLSGAEERSVTIGSQICIDYSSTFNTVNLFTDSDQGALFTGCTKQNPPLGWSMLPFPLLYPSEPSSLQLIPPSVLWLIFGCPRSGDSLLRDGWLLCTDSTLAEVRSVSSELRLHPWGFLWMVQAEGALVEQGAEHQERSRPKEGRVHEGHSR